VLVKFLGWSLLWWSDCLITDCRMIFCSRAFQRFAVKTNRTLENLSSKGRVLIKLLQILPFVFYWDKYCWTMTRGSCWVSTLTYPNLLGTKRLCCCYCCCISTAEHQ
jgi:hypothetical protein